jgi:hypothetical protein
VKILPSQHRPQPTSRTIHISTGAAPSRVGLIVQQPDQLPQALARFGNALTGFAESARLRRLTLVLMGARGIPTSCPAPSWSVLERRTKQAV